jgi:CheY-like chemotaxis protein
MKSDFVLLVDDDPDVRDLLAEVLRDEGHDVACARDGREALEILARRPDACLILLDLYMPSMDGSEFRAIQRREARWATIPVVVMTAASDGNARARALGAAGYLRKPMTLEDLLAVVARHCPGGHRALPPP